MLCKQRKVHSIPIPVQHWQLRNMLCHSHPFLIFNRNKRLIFYNTKLNIMKEVFNNVNFNATAIEISNMCDIDCSSTSNSCEPCCRNKNPIKNIIMGGSRGEFLLMTNTKILKGFIDEMIINCIKFVGNKFYVCSNSKYLRVYDVNKISQNKNCIVKDYYKKELHFSVSNLFYNSNNSLDLHYNGDHNKKMFDVTYKDAIDVRSSAIYSLEHPFQINCCSISPDKKIIGTIGDTDEIRLYDERIKNVISKAKLIIFTDSAFGFTWHESSQLFAVCGQDGKVCIFDIRNLSSHVRILSRQRDVLNKAIRNVLFAKDYLIFTEHQGNFAIVNINNMVRKDVKIRGNINGIVNCGNKLFIGTDSLLYEYMFDGSEKRSGTYSVF